jgi:hypothetical protein
MKFVTNSKGIPCLHGEDINGLRYYFEGLLEGKYYLVLEYTDVWRELKSPWIGTNIIWKDKVQMATEVEVKHETMR